MPNSVFLTPKKPVRHHVDKGEDDRVDDEDRVAATARRESYNYAGDENVERQGSHKKILPHFVSKERFYGIESHSS